MTSDKLYHDSSPLTRQSDGFSPKSQEMHTGLCTPSAASPFPSPGNPGLSREGTLVRCNLYQLILSYMVFCKSQYPKSISCSPADASDYLLHQASVTCLSTSSADARIYHLPVHAPSASISYPSGVLPGPLRDAPRSEPLSLLKYIHFPPTCCHPVTIFPFESK